MINQNLQSSNQWSSVRNLPRSSRRALSTQCFAGFSPSGNPVPRQLAGKQLTNASDRNVVVCRQSVSSMTASIALVRAIPLAVGAKLNERRRSAPQGRASFRAAGIARRSPCDCAQVNQARRHSLTDFRTGQLSGIGSSPWSCREFGPSGDGIGVRWIQAPCYTAPKHHDFDRLFSNSPQVTTEPIRGKGLPRRRSATAFDDCYSQQACLCRDHVLERSRRGNPRRIA